MSLLKRFPVHLSPLLSPARALEWGQQLGHLRDCLFRLDILHLLLPRFSRFTSEIFIDENPRAYNGDGTGRF